MYNIFIDGSAGTTGLRIKERLKKRKNINILELPERLRKNAKKRAEISNECDLVFLCLSDTLAKEAVLNINKDVKIIDASTAHRTEESWVYGMPELCANQRNKIINAKKVANCGCHATGFIALVRPLVENSIIDANYPITAHSITGYSGGGKKLINEYKENEKNSSYESPFQYALMQNHKHLPEMQMYSLLDSVPSFQPIVAKYYSGMSVTVPLIKDLLKTNISLKNLIDIYKDYYKDSHLISVNNEFKTKLIANEYSGYDNMEINVFGKDNLIVNACFDNLGKGASGTAIQNMNLMLGFDETEGLKIKDKELIL